MRTDPGALLRTLAFGDLDTGTWGAVWSQGDARPALLSLGSGSGAVTRQVSIVGSGEDDEWRLEGDGVELTFTARARAAVAPIAGAQIGGFEQLCEVGGRFVIGADEHELHQCPGRRGARIPKVELARVQSAREVSAWFGPGDAFALLALRPLGAAGHGQDLVGAALLDSGGAVTLTDPRLSSTYDAAGRATRASVELWLGPPDNEQYPRRATGEALGPAGEAVDAGGERLDPGLELHTALWRWRSGAHEGAGVYVLARF